MNVKLLMRHIPVTSRDRPRRNAITARGRARSNAQIKRQRIEPELLLSLSLFQSDSVHSLAPPTDSLIGLRTLRTAAFIRP